MYEDWDDRANECVTDEILQKIQTILDKAFASDSVKQYWTLEKKIVI
ncbi:hypothetical protein [Lysinibacillus sp. NPDC056185]